MAITHTIRAKRTLTPIVTLTPKFFARCKECHPEAFGMAFSAFAKQYRRGTGKTPVLDHAQQQELQASYGADEEGRHVSRFTGLPGRAYQMTMLMRQALENSASFDFAEALELAQELYTMLEMRYLAKAKCLAARQS